MKKVMKNKSKTKNLELGPYIIILGAHYNAIKSLSFFYHVMKRAENQDIFLEGFNSESAGKRIAISIPNLNGCRICKRTITS